MAMGMMACAGGEAQVPSRLFKPTTGQLEVNCFC